MSDSATTNRRLREPGRAIWSIGIYAGTTLFDLAPCADIQNPVLLAENVTDIPAEFVADPFMIHAAGCWQMFFEVMNAETEKGEIGWARSEDGLSWNYEGIVLKESFHLSYPYVLCAGGEYYMIPESHKAGRTQLYRANGFPERWSRVASIMDGNWVDSSIFFFDDLWWMFTCPGDSASSTLALFYSSNLDGPWLPHAMNPLIADSNRIARPSGRVLVLDDRILRFCQDCFPRYGTRVRAFEIIELSTTTYFEQEIAQGPVLAGGDQNWNRTGMHHVDPHWTGNRWLACVDGFRLKEERLAVAVPGN